MNMEQLQKENDELKEKLEAKHLDAQTWANASMWKDVEINELRANVELLREAILLLDSWNWEAFDIYDSGAIDDIESAIRLLSTIQAQSTNHIESRVEEETLLDCELELESYGDSFGADLIRTKARKYKEQSDD